MNNFVRLLSYVRVSLTTKTSNWLGRYNISFRRVNIIGNKFYYGRQNTIFWNMRLHSRKSCLVFTILIRNADQSRLKNRVVFRTLSNIKYWAFWGLIWQGSGYASLTLIIIFNWLVSISLNRTIWSQPNFNPLSLFSAVALLPQDQLLLWGCVCESGQEPKLSWTGNRPILHARPQPFEPLLP